jgi:hypothetical protein
MQYLKSYPCECGTANAQKEQTILRAVYCLIASHVTYDEQSLALSLTHLHFQLRIHESREKHNPGDL